MDEVIRKVAALGLPGVTLVITMAATGFAGAAAITTALAALGGPFGMLGRIGVLGVMALVADALSKYGIDTLLAGIYLERSKTESIGVSDRITIGNSIDFYSEAHLRKM